MKLGILGAKGRMGQMIAREIASGQYDATLAASLDKDSNSTEKESAFIACDALIDFSSPSATQEHASLASQYKKPLVVGTTGLSAKEEAALKAAAENIPVFYSANMSIGVNVLAAAVEQVAQRLNEEFDIEIFEAHHKHKVDSPSGTALLLAAAAAKGRGTDLKSALIETHHQNGVRTKGAIGMSVFRGGDVVGEHTVTFAGVGERIDLAHKATDRAIFARGAIKAALWLKDKNPGLYSMRDMLDI